MSNKRTKKIFSKNEENTVNKKLATGEDDVEEEANAKKNKNKNKNKNKIDMQIEVKKSAKDLKPVTEEEKSLEDYLEENLKLEEELNNLKNEYESQKDSNIEEIKKANEEIDQKNKEMLNLGKKNKKLITELKNIDKNINEKYSKYIEKQMVKKRKDFIKEKKTSEKDIKAKENQIKNIKKFIDVYKKEKENYEKLEKEIDNGLESNKNNENEELKQKLTDIENEIKDLTKISSEHKACKNTINNMKIKIEILLNDIEFEKKRGEMLTKLIRDKNTNIDNEILEEGCSRPVGVEFYNTPNELYNNRMNYGLRLLLEVLKNAPPPEVKINKSASRYIENALYSPPKKIQKEYIDNYQKKKITSLIDNKLLTDNNLFTERENNFLKTIIPENYFNKYKEIFNDKKKENAEIEQKFTEFDEKKKTNMKMSYEIEHFKLKSKEQEIIKTDLEVKFRKNNQKIKKIQNEIGKLKVDIEKQDKILSRTEKTNKKYLDIIQVFNKNSKK